jgi:hypothetical protein
VRPQTPIDSPFDLAASLASKVRCKVRHDAVTRAHLPLQSFREVFLRRADLLKPDVVSEVILIGAGALVLLILILILFVVLTHTSMPI